MATKANWLDTGAVELTVKPLSSHLVTRKLNSPTNSLRTPYMSVSGPSRVSCTRPYSDPGDLLTSDIRNEKELLCEHKPHTTCLAASRRFDWGPRRWTCAPRTGLRFCSGYFWP
eukprot:7834965-Pyramimonas_sp.AAC.2